MFYHKSVYATNNSIAKKIIPQQGEARKEVKVIDFILHKSNKKNKKDYPALLVADFDQSAAVSVWEN